MTRIVVRIVNSVVLILVAFVVAGLIYQISGYPLPDVFTGVWQGAVAAPGALESTLRWSIPLLIASCGVLISFRAGFFNVGAQGQFYAGAIGALAVALTWQHGPAALVVPAGILAAAAAGALWAFLPAILRIRFNTDEVLTTLMMNFIGALMLQYFTDGPFKEPTASGEVTASKTITDAFRLSDSSGVSPSLVAIALAVLLLTWYLMNRSAFGLQSNLVGRNPLMARWQGINVGRLGLIAFLLAGALAGVAGSIELFGPSGRLVSGFAPTLGFSAVLVALVGELSVLGVAAAALFFGGLQSAILYLPIVTQLPQAALDLLDGIVAMVITVRVLPALLLRRRSRTAPATPVETPAQAMEV